MSIKHTDARWRAVAIYRSQHGAVDVEWFFEEISELEALIENGPHWGSLVRCTITPNRTSGATAPISMEAAAEL